MMATDQNNQEARQSLLAPLFADDVALAATDPAADQPVPLPEELNGLSPRAVEKRRREFAAGRAVARAAMAQLDHSPAPILVGKDRAPVWPKGLIGSITHCKTCAMAAVSTSDRYAGLGLDVEEDTPLKSELWDAICSKREQDWMRAHHNPAQMGKLIFSAKEAAYKCQYNVSRRYFGFEGMELEFDMTNHSFRAEFTADQVPFVQGTSLFGRFAIGAGLIITAVSLSTNWQEA